MNSIHLVEGVSLNLERYGFPRNRPFRLKVKPHFSRRFYSGNLPSGQKMEGTNPSCFFHTIIWYTGKPILWTPGRLESGRQDALILDTCSLEIWTPERLDNSLTFSN